MYNGRTYIVKKGDTLSSIAVRVYGTTSKEELLRSANPGNLFVGRRLLVPYNSLDLHQVGSGVTIIIAGVSITPESCRILSSIEAIARSWTATIAWNPGENSTLDAALKPFVYPDAKVYIDGDLIVSGRLYGVNPFLGDGCGVELEGFSYAADAIDSTINPPYQWYGMDLQQHANTLLKQVGLKAIFLDSAGSTFDTIDAEATDTIANHLSKLALERGKLVFSDEYGNFVFGSTVSGGDFGSLVEGHPPVSEWKGAFDGRELFHTYRVLGSSPDGDDKSIEAFDTNVPVSRTMSVKADDNTAWEIGRTAEWKRGRQLADAISILLPVSTWRSSNNKVWKAGGEVNIVSETLMVPKGFKFLIRTVEFALEEGRQEASLSIVPPGVYGAPGNRVVTPWT